MVLCLFYIKETTPSPLQWICTWGCSYEARLSLCLGQHGELKDRCLVSKVKWCQDPRGVLPLELYIVIIWWLKKYEIVFAGSRHCILTTNTKHAHRCTKRVEETRLIEKTTDSPVKHITSREPVSDSRTPNSHYHSERHCSPCATNTSPPIANLSVLHSQKSNHLKTFHFTLQVKMI